MIQCGANTDVLYPGDSNDRIYGDGANNSPYGGNDDDTVVFINFADSAIATGIDRIQDFATGAYRIDLNLVDANTTTPLTNDVFVSAGKAMP